MILGSLFESLLPSVGVKIDSLGVIACSINPKAMCKGVVWLAKGPKPACMQVLRALDGKTLFYSPSKDLSHLANKCKMR